MKKEPKPGDLVYIIENEHGDIAAGKLGTVIIKEDDGNVIVVRFIGNSKIKEWGCHKSRVIVI